MRLITVLSLAVVTVLGSGGVGCRKPAQADAGQQLQQSFQTAEPEVKKAMDTVTANLKAGEYAQATRALAPVVTDRPLTDAQRQAVGTALNQINQYVAANPKLDTKEMYEMRARMFQAVHAGKRF